MATYNGAMSVGGDSAYSSTAGGYQIAGSDATSAWATVVLPDTYTDYESCRIDCVLYASTAPASWLSSWECGLDIYKDGYSYGATQVLNRTAFGAGSGASSRTFGLTLSGGYFSAGDEVQIRFNGSDGGYVDGSNRCVYLRSATFTSNNAYKNISLYFSANGGSGAPSTQENPADTSGYASFTIPSTSPTRSGFTFLGWATSSGATTAAYTAGNTYSINTNKTLYAVWQTATYSFTIMLYKGGDYSAWTNCTNVFKLYNAGVGVQVYTFYQSQEAIHYRTVDNVPAGTYTLYMDDVDLGQTVVISSTSVMVLAVRFRTITYNANGATGGTLPVDTGVYFNGTAATILQSSLVYPGYVFTGWNTAADGTGTAYAAGDSVTLTASPTLYAIWERSNAVNIYLDSTWKTSTAHVYTGESWEVPQAYVYDGTTWKNS